jgi:hypothetical protein
MLREAQIDEDERTRNAYDKFRELAQQALNPGPRVSTAAQLPVVRSLIGNRDFPPLTTWQRAALVRNGKANRLQAIGRKGT